MKNLIKFHIHVLVIQNYLNMWQNFGNLIKLRLPIWLNNLQINDFIEYNQKLSPSVHEISSLIKKSSHKQLFLLWQKVIWLC